MNPSVINEVFKPVVPNTNIFAKKKITGNLICTVISIQGALSFKMYCQFMEKICVYSHQTSKSGYCCTHTPKSSYQKAVFILQNRNIRKLYSYSKIGISESCIHTPKHTLYTINEPFIAGYISSMFPMQCYKLWVHFIVG